MNRIFATSVCATPAAPCRGRVLRASQTGGTPSHAMAPPPSVFHPQTAPRRRAGSPALSALLVAALVGACGTGQTDIVIGYAFPGSGVPSVSVAQDEFDSLAAQDGLRIRIVYDSTVLGDRADVEVARARRLVETPGIVAVVGHGGSRASLAASPVYNQAQVVQVIPTSTSRLLRDVGQWSFVLSDNDSVEGALIAEFARERLRGRRVTIFYTNDEYGIGLRDGVAAGLGQGVEVLDEVLVTPSVDFEPLVDAALLRGTPDVAVIAARCIETGAIVRLLHERAPGVQFVTGDGAMVFPCLSDYAGAVADSIYAVAFWLPDQPDSLSRAFVKRFRRVTGADPTPSQAMSHAALTLLRHAIRVVGPSPDAIRDFLGSLGTSRPPVATVVGLVGFAAERAPRMVMARVTGDTLVRVVVP